MRVREPGHLKDGECNIRTRDNKDVEVRKVMKRARDVEVQHSVCRYNQSDLGCGMLRHLLQASTPPEESTLISIIRVDGQKSVLRTAVQRVVGMATMDNARLASVAKRCIELRLALELER